jgi:cobalt-zinc-cadmium efflux system protein
MHSRPGGGHGDAHHHHGHGGDRAGDRRRLGATLVLVLAYLGAEVAGGLVTGSLALLADAGHMVSDAAALGLSLFALGLADRRSPSAARTFGFHRAEILAALANGAALIVIALLVAVEAVERLLAPTPVSAPGLIAVAAGGLLVNVIALWLLHGSRESSLNMRGAWLHVASDALGSMQAILAGGLIWAFGWQWADPVASLLIAALVVRSAWSLLRESLGVLMEGTPPHIDVDRVRDAMLELRGVEEVHDLHVWSIASGFECLSAHVVASLERTSMESRDDLLSELRCRLHDRFGIDHITIQLEPLGFVEARTRCR